jgi:predicted nucleic acid-binding protein
VILVDTSVWADHIHKGDTRLAELLDEGLVLMHPFVIGEIALGNLKPREPILATLRKLPAARVASDEEVLELIRIERLFGTGLGLVDAHLLASARIEASSIWTRDKRMLREAQRLGLARDR